MKFFLIIKEDGEWLFSPFAEMAKPAEAGEVLQPALPLGVLESLLLRVLEPGKNRCLPTRAELKEKVVTALRRGLGAACPDLRWSLLGTSSLREAYRAEVPAEARAALRITATPMATATAAIRKTRRRSACAESACSRRRC